MCISIVQNNRTANNDWLLLARHRVALSRDARCICGLRGIRYQVTRTWGQSKRREDAHTLRETRAHADVFGSDEMMPRALASARSARDEMKNENGYEIGNGQGIYLAVWRKTQPNGRHVESSTCLFSRSPVLSSYFLSSPSAIPTLIYSSCIREGWSMESYSEILFDSSVHKDFSPRSVFLVCYFNKIISFCSLVTKAK